MPKSIIKELFYNFVESSEPPRKYYLLLDRINDNTQQLRKTMNKKNKKRLQGICDDYEQMTAFETDTAFCDGFSLAVQLMSEAFGRSQ